MPASNNLSNTSFKFEILLDVGSHSNSFSYLETMTMTTNIKQDFKLKQCP